MSAADVEPAVALVLVTSFLVVLGLVVLQIGRILRRRRKSALRNRRREP